MRPTLALASLAVASLFTLSSSAEEVEHPAYKSWVRHPIGTTVATRSRTVNSASTLTTTTTTTLVELKPDAAILETRRVSDATGRVVEGLPDRYEQRKMFPLLPGVKREEIGRPSKAVEQGEETLSLVGREIKTFWYDTKGTGEAGETLTRTWLSDDVPGRLVKAVTQYPTAKTTITIELVEFKAPAASK